MSVQFRLELTLQELWKIVKDCKKCHKEFLGVLLEKARKQQDRGLEEQIIRILEGK